MPPLLGPAGLIGVLLVGGVLLALLARTVDWPRRRGVQLLILIAPLAGLVLAIAGLHHARGHTCRLGPLPWEYRLDTVLATGIGAIAAAGLGAGLVRLVLMDRVMRRRGYPARPELQQLVADLGARLGVPVPRVVVCLSDQPLALTYGVVRPTILLSTWLIERLDREELEAVIAHELAHVARRDFVLAWLATVLRDAFFYLPTSRIAHHQLLREKEPACDELALRATARPLALASALAKVWQKALDTSPAAMAQAFAEPGTSIEQRINRLLEQPRRQVSHARAPMVALTAGAGGLASLLIIEAANLAVLLTPFGCGPGTPLGRLF